MVQIKLMNRNIFLKIIELRNEPSKVEMDIALTQLLVLPCSSHLSGQKWRQITGQLCP